LRYQSHSPEEKGMVDSNHRLERLKLPQRLDGKSVLDIGCNEGFFCGIAASLGASRIIGIDNNPEVIDFARMRYKDPAIEFRTQTWRELSCGAFDLVLWTSAMHYELDPLYILRQISQQLNNDAVFVLECGIASGVHGKEMVPVQRHDGTFWYPTMALLEDHLLSDFDFRMVSHGELVGLDPVPRYVYHCKRRKPILILLRGKPYAGKSTAARVLRPSATKIIGLDTFTYRILTAKYHHTPFEKHVKENRKHDYLTYFYEGIDDAGFTQDYVEMIANGISSTDRLVVVEGYMTDQQSKMLRSVLADRVTFWDNVPVETTT